jgi:hypothetical protein
MTGMGFLAWVAFGAITVASGTSASPDTLADLLPAEMRGFKPGGGDEIYNFDNLFRLIDGSAEVYRALNVRTVLDRRYVKKGAADIIVDVFDMGSSQDAFGAYHHDMREEKAAGIGQESEYAGGALHFWKDRYFVSVVALRETDDSTRAVLALGKAIAAAIPRKGAAPKLVEWLPSTGLIPAQVHYFHDWVSLNRRYTLAEENLLELTRKTEGVLARYRCASQPGGGTGSQSFALVLINYPSPRSAEEAHRRFLDKYLPDRDEQGVVRTENNRWAGSRQQGTIFVGVFDAPTRAEVLRLMDEISQAQGR